MKEATWVVEFVSPCLANSGGPAGEKDRFLTDSKGRLIFSQAQHYSAFTKAIEVARVRGVKAGDIQPDLLVEAPTALYERRYGEDKYRTHEAIMPGTRVQFKAVVDDRITESVFRLILEKLGSYVGFSPYGFKLGFGKYVVISVTVAPSDAAETVVQ